VQNSRLSRSEPEQNIEFERLFAVLAKSEQETVARLKWKVSRIAAG